MGMLFLFIDTKCTIYLGIFMNYEQYDIFVLKQYNIEYQTFFSHLSLEKLVNNQKSCYE